MEINHAKFPRHFNPLVFCAFLVGGCGSDRRASQAPEVDSPEPAEMQPQVQEEEPAPEPVGPPRMLSNEEAIALRVARTGSASENEVSEPLPTTSVPDEHPVE